jgi:hypothetical protein
VRLSADGQCGAGGEGTWKLPFIHDPKVPRTFQAVVRVQSGETEHVYTADATHDTIAFSAEAARSFGAFVLMGIQHIGAWPTEWYGPQGFHFPDGIDHIMFLLGLILLGGSVLQLVGTATGFTAGHSITLALATLGVVHVPSRIVEPAIALSIAFVAAETFFVKHAKSRWRIAMAFGLVHGFGFASALADLHLAKSSLAGALVGFNVGVELGQAAIVAVLAPLIAMMRRRAFFRRYAIPAGAGGIFCCGITWFVQRAFLF